ncbi:MAG: SusD/RagB family nutrient-binding outer membrane lipoprotein [Saprospiraceae bacterium]|nr:SusD/RagB family nutrient-binding outer membrane lipoprotein [Saprospiraceae bacterium]
MKKQIKYIAFLSAICLGLLVSSCQDYLDINTDPTRVNESQVTLAAMLPTVIEGTSQTQYNFAFTLSQVTQNMCSVTGGGADRHIEIRLPGAWSTTYLTAMSNATLMIEKANAQNSPHYAAAGKILLAYNLNMATTAWESVPYSEAFSIKTLTPNYDSQESIFQKIGTLLDEAILDLDKTSVKKMSADDLVYAGNLVRWKAAAKALKARIALQYSAKGATAAANNALTALSSAAMTSNADDFQLVYNLRNLNPWNTGVAIANTTGNLSIRHSQQFVDAMNGTMHGVFDPRLPIVGGRVAANAAATTWVGGENGVGLGNVDLNPTTSWHSKNISPIQFVTFSEQKFIQAEAEFLKNGGTTTSKGTTAAGYQAYLDGIISNMNKLGVADTGRTRYMAAPQVAVGAANLTLQHIMSEKFKALFLNPETWSDYRRWDFSKDVFKDLDLPKNQSVDLGGKWIERALYPLDEFSRNGSVVAKNQKNANVKMWIFSK